MNTVFDLCVRFLVWAGNLLNLTYVEINVWIFCIIWPALTLGLIIWVWRLKRHTKLLKAFNTHRKMASDIEYAIANLPDGTMLDRNPKCPDALITFAVRGGRRAPLGSGGYTLDENMIEGEKPRWIKCNDCGMQSFHPSDVEHLFCGQCKVFHVKQVNNLQPTTK